ncbi:ATP-binding protein [Fortiea contorta]|uniref:ATP-binding protein n=1 Tax=Fortiea contorta TaxID=1892405 RepID=UPI0003654AEC|nr:ATP-binding protein [Fortiea contorta]
MLSDIFNQLIKLIEQGETVICCESPFQERYRILRYISQCCASIKTPCLLWNLGQETIKQIDDSDSEQINIRDFDEYIPPLVKDSKDYFRILKFWENYQGEGVLIIENLYPWISANVPQETQFFLLSEWVKSNLLNLSLTKCADSGIKCAILLGSQADIHPEMLCQIPLLTQDLPDTSEILIAINEEAEGLLPPTFNEKDKITIARSGIGLYISDFLKGLKSISFHHDDSSEEIAKNLLQYKINLLNKLYEIEFIPPPKVALGGLELMQEAFKKFKRLFSPLAKAYKLKVPKGIMLVGPPGTGKSHSAKVCSQILGVPLILVDWGNFRSYGNEAERRLKKLLKLADSLNEVVIYFDDFDKGFSGDDDVARRLAGQLLTWMQERTSDVIVIASVNRMEWLPPELTRAGRFDYIYKVDLPNYGERHTIFKLHSARFDNRFGGGDDPYSQEEWRRLLKETNRCVGAEIQTIVERAAASTFCQMFPEDIPLFTSELPPLEISVATLLEERRQINPLAIREADRVESMRNKADIQGLPSSPADSSQYAISNVDIFGG